MLLIMAMSGAGVSWNVHEIKWKILCDSKLLTLLSAVAMVPGGAQ